MKIFIAHLKPGIAFVVANDVVEAQKLLNDYDFIIGRVSIDDIGLVEPFVVTGGFSAVIGVYQE